LSIGVNSSLISVERGLYLPWLITGAHFKVLQEQGLSFWPALNEKYLTGSEYISIIELSIVL